MSAENKLMSLKESSNLHFLLLAELLHSINELFKLQFGEQPMSPVLHLLHEQLQVLSLNTHDDHMKQSQHETDLWLC